MSGIVTDGIGLLIVAVAPIPLIQKVAIFASFWIVSIFISVVTLHPIILSYIKPPPEQHGRTREQARAGQHLGGARHRLGGCRRRRRAEHGWDDPVVDPVLGVCRRR